jgi:hypothetical protein
MPGSTSYFSEPEAELDPRLFAGQQLRPWVRNGVLSLLMEHLVQRYASPQRWVTAWLAGSGVSYQWSAAREPGDLDCLVGVDYPRFRESNPDYSGLSDTEISRMLNEGFSADLMPNTANWNSYELTYYVNPGATDIRAINPYAAYDITNDDWTVHPDPGLHAPFSRAWAIKADLDHEMATDIVRRYSQALTDLRAASNPAYRVNAESRLRHTLSAATSLYDEIHRGRHIAFSPVGGGYTDYNNYRWQAGKAKGTVAALRMLKDYSDEAERSEQVQTYGMELPSADVLTRRAAIYRQ